MGLRSLRWRALAPFPRGISFAVLAAVTACSPVSEGPLELVLNDAAEAPRPKPQQPEKGPNTGNAGVDSGAAGANGGGPTTEPCVPPAAEQPKTVTVFLQPGPEGKDARITTQAGGVDRPRPDDAVFDARFWTWGGEPGVFRSLIQFDLSSIPSDDITHAKLTLRAEPGKTEPPYYFGHHGLDGALNDAWLVRVLEPWTEEAVTWNSQPRTTVVPDTAASADWRNTFYLSATKSTDTRYDVDLTQTVRDMRRGDVPNHGFLIRLATEERYRALVFASSDHADPTLRPRLEVVYRLPAGIKQR